MYRWVAFLGAVSSLVLLTSGDVYEVMKVLTSLAPVKLEENEKNQKELPFDQSKKE